MSFFATFFGRREEKNRPHSGKASAAQRFRKLHLEPLESREMLSVSPIEFSEIRSRYADLELSENMADYNIIEITAENLTDAKLRAAITEAGTTSENDLIVLRTTPTQNKITLNGSELSVNHAVSTYGSTTIISFGTSELSIDADQKSRVFNISDSSSVALAGLTITGGKTGGAGGGIHLSVGTLTLTNCTITGNSTATAGGGILNSGGSLTLTGCMLSENMADGDGGGGIFNSGGSLTLTKSTITGNMANWGGGIFNHNSTLTLTDTTITENTAKGNDGGGIHNSGEGSLSLTGSTISGNTASSSGGGIYNRSDTLTLTDTTISGNTASSSGGGIYNRGDTLTLTDTTISGNTAGWGGGIHNFNGTLTLTDSVISGNTAEIQGGGIRNYGGSLTITNTMISGNTADYIGGGIDNPDESSALTLINSTVTGNTGGLGGGISNSGTAVLFNTIIAKNSEDIRYYSGTIGGSNNLSTFTDWETGSNDNLLYDPELPLFLDAENGDYRLASGSQAIDKGNDQLAFEAGLDQNSLDLAGNPRFSGTSIDIGAFEFSGTIIDPPAVPTGFGLKETASNSITLQWNSAADAMQYELQYRVDGASSWLTAPAGTSTSNLWTSTVSGLKPDAAYNFRLRAKNADGESNWTDTINGKTEPMSEQEKLIACEALAKEIASQIAYYGDAPNLIQGENEMDGQCGDYALLFVLAWNERYSTDEAKLVIQQQGMDFVPDGIYSVVRKSDIDPQEFSFVRDRGVSGIYYYWNGEMGWCIRISVVTKFD